MKPVNKGSSGPARGARRAPGAPQSASQESGRTRAGQRRFPGHAQTTPSRWATPRGSTGRGRGMATTGKTVSPRIASIQSWAESTVLESSFCLQQLQRLCHPRLHVQNPLRLENRGQFNLHISTSTRAGCLMRKSVLTKRLGTRDQAAARYACA